MLRYAVVGSGAVGGFYGIRLAHAGARVQFLLRRDVAEVRARGLELESAEGDIRLAKPHLAGSWSQLEQCDVLLVAVKATANADVLGHLARHADRLIAPGGGILLVQNGIGAEPAYAAAAGCSVLGGLAVLCAHLIRPGTVRHLDLGSLTIAAHHPSGDAAGVCPLMLAIADDLTRAGTEVHLDEDLVRARWRKLMWNIPFNPLSVILDATTDELMGDANTVELVRAIMNEVAAAAAAEGRTLPSGLIDGLLAATAGMAPYATSMKLDADAGRPMEVEAMLAEPLRRAALTGTAMPSVSVLHRELGFLDARAQRRSGRPTSGQPPQAAPDPA
ncbi:MAG: 2-dehydropantoate 2-reductase, partial [Candidatus Nanopelagicales bacterium]